MDQDNATAHGSRFARGCRRVHLDRPVVWGGIPYRMRGSGKADRDADSDALSVSDLYSHCDGDPHRHAHIDRDAHPDAHTYQDTHPDADADPDTHTHRHSLGAGDDGS